MTCEQVGRELQSYVDGEITDPQLLEALESHIRQCKPCHHRLATRRRLVQLLKKAFEVRRGSSAIAPRNHMP